MYKFLAFAVVAVGAAVATTVYKLKHRDAVQVEELAKRNKVTEAQEAEIRG
jgi:hypothetical protein